MLDTTITSSIRGMSVVNDKILWLSGSNGTVGRSLDGGISIKWLKVNGFEKRDFRDVEAFDAKTAIIMAIDTPAIILKTTDGGISWKKVFEDKRPGMFLDAMEFWNLNSGIVVGDPIDGKIFIARTFDGGETWRGLPEANYPKVETGEAMFASSGTNVIALDKDEACFATGGTMSRIFVRDDSYELPFSKGNTMGANSIAVNNRKNMVVVGGDFLRDTSSVNNCFLLGPSYRTWIRPDVPPYGYKSCVIYFSKHKLITCGTSGVDISSDGGVSWKTISRTGFHVVQSAKKGKNVFLAGRNKVAKLVW